MSKTSTYKELIVWQKAIALVTEVYSTSKAFPDEEKFGLTSQMNRAVVSVPTNIAEGWGRESTKNYLQFLRIARGSLMEVETLLLISKNLHYIAEENYQKIIGMIDEVGKILQGLIKSIQVKTKMVEYA